MLPTRLFAAGHALEDLAAQAEVVGDRVGLDETPSWSVSPTLGSPLKLPLPFDRPRRSLKAGGWADAEVRVLVDGDVEGVVGRVEGIDLADLAVAESGRSGTRVMDLDPGNWLATSGTDADDDGVAGGRGLDEGGRHERSGRSAAKAGTAKDTRPRLARTLTAGGKRT